MVAKRMLGLATMALLVAPTLPHMGTARADATQTIPPHGVLFAGLQNGYLYRSTDGGYNWQESDSGLPSGTDITVLAVAQGGSTTLYAGTNGNGVFISTDGGVHWQDDNAGDYDLENASIRGLAVDPAHSQTVYTVTADDQLYASMNSGAYWTTTSLPTSSQATTLALNPRNTAMLLVGTTDSGIFQSLDRGGTWYSTNDGSMGAVNGLAFNPRNPDVAFAATSTGMYQTIDGGNNWEVEQRGVQNGTSFQSVAVDPNNGARIIAGTTDGLFYRSQDGGTSWSAQGSTFGRQINTIAFDAARTGAVLAGTGDASVIYFSDDNGDSWHSTSTGFGNYNGILVLTSTARAPLPTDPVPAPQGNPYGVRYFNETHHTVRGPFLSFYNKYNGLKIFGLPLTEDFTEGGHLVQYFERSLMVYANGHMSLAPLGSQLTAGRSFAPAPCCPPAGQMWFWQTAHTLSGSFLNFWRTHNGSFLFGYPISQPLYEQNGDGTGRTYLVQYFQNARMEYHPELAGTGNVVTLGLLGRQVLHQRGWI